MITATHVCQRCEGEGDVGEPCDPDFHQTGVRCRYCHGRGYHMVTCPDCDGTGETDNEDETPEA